MPSRAILHASKHVLVALLLAGCATMEVGVDSSLAPGASLPEAFRWAGGRIVVEDARGFQRATIEPVLRAATSAELSARGFRESAAEAPGFRVVYALVIEEKAWETTMRDFDSYRGGRLGTPAAPVEVVNRYEEGLLALELIDTSGDALWRGWARAEVHRDSRPAQRDARIREAVSRILRELPPPAQRRP